MVILDNILERIAHIKLPNIYLYNIAMLYKDIRSYKIINDHIHVNYNMDIHDV